MRHKLFVLGGTYDDGLGIRLGQSVGAALENMDEPFITAPFYPPSSLVKGLIVNKLGQRFVAEDSYHARTSYFVLQQPDSAAYLIADSDHMEEQRMPLVPLKDGYETIEEMEAALELPRVRWWRRWPATTSTPRAARIPTSTSTPTGWRRRPPARGASTTSPSAPRSTPASPSAACATGLDGEVLREDRSVIPGLYAAGACASNIAQDGAGYCSGTQLGEGSFFGRRAGRAQRRAQRSAVARVGHKADSADSPERLIRDLPSGRRAARERAALPRDGPARALGRAAAHARRPGQPAGRPAEQRGAAARSTPRRSGSSGRAIRSATRRRPGSWSSGRPSPTTTGAATASTCPPTTWS